ncbi:hypothetical protein GCM10009839_67180 [Catenulispora yoronensis]|uniref:Uncharacterized protein n=1 Tax=Catenulispora yoronensis TaxID=450799 RepID=A0ABN2V448_9ACTN
MCSTSQRSDERAGPARRREDPPTNANTNADADADAVVRHRGPAGQKLTPPPGRAPESLRYGNAGALRLAK